VHEPIVLSFFPPACIAHTGAILLHGIGQYTPPHLTPLVYAIHHTILAVVISCIGQGTLPPLLWHAPTLLDPLSLPRPALLYSATVRPRGTLLPLSCYAPPYWTPLAYYALPYCTVLLYGREVPCSPCSMPPPYWTPVAYNALPYCTVLLYLTPLTVPCTVACPPPLSHVPFLLYHAPHYCTMPPLLDPLLYNTPLLYLASLP